MMTTAAKQVAGHSDNFTSTIALLIGRWGTWPGYTPLLLKGISANPTVSFFVLSDTAPARRLPKNARHVALSLDALLARLRSTVGCTLNTLQADKHFATGPSAAKTNDLKPFWGVAFADLLKPFAFWGYLQEDILLGDLRAFATEELLARSDVVSPYLPPYNSSGVLSSTGPSPNISQ
jgi:hypothetical protein